MERRQQNRIDDTELQDYFRNFEQEFERRFQRDMPGEARRYLQLAEQVIRQNEQEMRNDSARDGMNPRL